MNKIKIAIYLYLFVFLSTVYSEKMRVIPVGIEPTVKGITVLTAGNGQNALIIIGGTVKTDSVIQHVIADIESGALPVPADKSLYIFPILVGQSGVDVLRNFPASDWQRSGFEYATTINCGVAPLSESGSAAINTLIKTINKQKIVIISLENGDEALSISDWSYYNRNLLALIEGEKIFTRHSILASSGDIGKWLAEAYGIAYAQIRTPDKIDERYQEIKPVVMGLLSAQFATDIYQRKGGTGESERAFSDALYDSLPEQIKKTMSDFQGFTTLFNEIKSDQELLILVNKKHYLGAVYTPGDLVKVDQSVPSTKSAVYLRSLVIPDLKMMYQAALQEGVHLTIVSAYRSYDTQKLVFEKWERAFGTAEAERVSARPGSSQHQLGTAIDFNVLDESFEKTGEGKWLFNNAYKYGFIISFPKNMEYFTGYRYEPWHYRYIGKKAALLVHEYFDNNLELFLQWYWSLF